MNLLRRLLPGIALVMGAFLFSIGIQTLAAWTSPGGSPPTSNAYSPLNTGPTAQTKSGSLTVGGQITIMGGAPGAGKVLTSNASGLASWTTPSSVTSVATNNGLTGGTITTSGTLGLNTGGGLLTCTNTATNKLLWDSTNSRLVCGTDQTGAGGVTGPGSANYIPKWTGGTSLGNSMISENLGGVDIGPLTAQGLFASAKLRLNGSIYVENNWYKAGNLTSLNNAIGVWGAEGGMISGFASGRAVGIGQTTSGYAGLGISSGATSLGAFYHDPFSNETAVEAYGARNIRFSTNGGTRMTLTSGGNVGIGTAVPLATLHVVAGTDDIGTSGIYGMAVTRSTGWSGIGLDGGDAGTMLIHYGGDGSNQIRFGRYTNGFAGWQANPFSVDMDAPDGSLIVDNAGDIWSARNINTQDVWLRNANKWATSYSDLQLKKNVEPLTNTLDKVLNLRGVSFNWNESYAALGHPNDKRQIGIIAQELETQFPELVTASSADGYKTINYEGLTAVLLEGMKEQQKEIASLKTRIEALEKK